MKKLLTLLFVLLVAGGLYAQDPHFTQFYAAPIYLNPAFAGTAKGPRFALNYRNQWPGLSGAFVTYSASYDQHFDKLGGGIGAQVMYDRAGDGNLSTTYANVVYSYHLTVKDDPNDFFIVKGALQAGAFQRSIDFSKLRFGDQIHPRLGFIYDTQERLPSRNNFSGSFTPDFSAGVMGFSKRFYAGLAVHHLVEPSQSFLDNPESVLPRKYTLHGGMTLPVDKWRREPNTFISPNLLVMRQARFTQVNIGAYLIKNYFIAGLWLRHTDPNTDAVAALIGFKQDPVKIGYSYDLTVSQARYAATGSHEVSMIIELPASNPRNVSKWKRISCPDF